MKATIIYDNTAWDQRLTPDWGFACLVEAHGRSILFDTGARGDVLLANMAALAISPADIEAVVISHDHWDHTGGLDAFLSRQPANIYIPASCRTMSDRAVVIGDMTKIFDNIYSTGELRNIEQSLTIKTDKGIVVIAGCSHSGVDTILKSAAAIGPVYALIGGLHGFSNFGALEDLSMVCPTHCTQHIREIKDRYPEKYMEGGAGRMIEM
ncbi:MAG: MBL fold metallo-hydrolase [Thermodesulfobacteriota bacterium]|nr:MBL fold metallo-hydrolase [Thermodesulfobacteriota bacterium]